MPSKKSKKKGGNFFSGIKRLWNTLGPGLITGASDDDPSGIATYSQAGAGFGLATLWTALLTFPLMAAVQEMCARIGAVTTHGLAGVLKNYYPRSIMYLMLLFSFPAIILNIGADIESMGAVMNMEFPRIPTFYFEIFFSALILAGVIQYNYHRIAAIMKWLCLVLLLYIFIPFLVKVNWAEVVKNTFVPHIQFNKDFLEIFVAILGTTISPYLFFWQATMEAEDIAESKTTIVIDKRFMSRMKTDIYSGMFFSNLVMFFIILTTGVVLYNAHITKIDTVEQAAKALEPLTGKVTYTFFAIGIIGTGFLAIPVLAGSLSYIVTETFGWQQGFQKKFTQAPRFYFIVTLSLAAGLSLDLLGITPIQALIYTAIFYGLTAPVMIAVVLHICNNKKVMGSETNGKRSNILGILTLILMSFAAIALIYFQFS